MITVGPKGLISEFIVSYNLFFTAFSIPLCVSTAVDKTQYSTCLLMQTSARSLLGVVLCCIMVKFTKLKWLFVAGEEQGPGACSDHSRAAFKGSQGETVRIGAQCPC